MTKIATITLNPAYDLMGNVHNLVINETNIINNDGLYPAGKGINVTKVLSDLGLKTLVTGFYGDQNPNLFNALIENMGCENQLYPVPGLTRVNIQIAGTTGITKLNFNGFTIEHNTWEQFARESLTMLQDYDYIAVCGSLPHGIDISAYISWLENLSKLGARVVFDSSGKALLEGISAKPWLIKPNLRELEEIVNLKLHSTEQILEIAMNINKQGIPNVIISMGDKGCLWVHKNFCMEATPPQTEHVVSTTGAGDSMVAAFIYSHINGFDPEETIKFATAVSAHAVTRHNVGITNMKDIEAYKAKVKIRKLNM